MDVGRIAVRQHVKADQQDNPSAKFVADEANHVDKETVATQTSHDRDDANPTPGGNHPGSQQSPGDSEKTRIAESDEHKGERNRAPGEKGTNIDVTNEPKIPKQATRPPPLRRNPSNDPSPGSRTRHLRRDRPCSTATASASAARYARRCDSPHRPRSKRRSWSHVDVQPCPLGRRPGSSPRRFGGDARPAASRWEALDALRTRPTRGTRRHEHESEFGGHRVDRRRRQSPEDA